MSESVSRNDAAIPSSPPPGDVWRRAGIRLVVGILVPCPVAALVPAVFMGFIDKSLLSVVIIYPLALFIACIAGGVQFVVHSFLMEFVVWRVFGRSWPAVLVSALLGLLVGVSIELTWAGGEFLETYMYAGFVAGLVTGCIVYRLRKDTGQRTDVKGS
ncbi:MAG: hypothetical protein JW741_21110 [Sedimentisphaerales bacterium]|nr:hypothetical protein [Sedimentisphaerales bacterium]